MTALDVAIGIVALIVVAILFSPRVRDSRSWLATVTPLASIIGSGFLVVAPLLGSEMGRAAPLAMAAIVLVAYAAGSAIRFNIVHLEPRLRSNRATRFERVGDEIASVVLGLAYVVSVAFYLRLLGAFVVRGLGGESAAAANGIASVLLVLIGSVGLARGLRGLERAEEASVSVKLAIIVALLLALAVRFPEVSLDRLALPAGPDDRIHALRVLLGLLLVVQGFETSRYLGEEYDARTRVRTMRRAQWISGAVYVVFVVLVLPWLSRSPRGPADEAALIDLSRHVAVALPPMLVLAAVMSQFSAAVADTIGAGGLLSEASGRRLGPRVAYALTSAAALALIWSVDIFGIIALASRAFALYYALQASIALRAAIAVLRGPRRALVALGLLALAALLLGAVALAIPAE